MIYDLLFLTERMKSEKIQKLNVLRDKEEYVIFARILKQALN